MDAQMLMKALEKLRGVIDEEEGGSLKARMMAKRAAPPALPMTGEGEDEKEEGEGAAALIVAKEGEGGMPGEEMGEGGEGEPSLDVLRELLAALEAKKAMGEGA